MTTQHTLKNPVTELRETLGFSRIDFARKIGIPYSSLANLELGYPNSVPRNITKALARAFGVDPTAFTEKYSVWRGQVS